MRQPWTPDDEAVLARRWAAGDRVADIAAGLGRPVVNVDGKVHRLGLPRRKPHWSATERDAVRRGFAAGDLRAVAARLGRKYEDALAQARKMGLRTGHGPYPPTTRAEALRLMRAGRSGRSVSRRLGVSPRALGEWRVAAGIPASSPAERSRQTKLGVRRAPVSAAAVTWYRRREAVAAAGWPFGATPADARVLAALEAGGPMTLRQIGAAVGLKPLPSGKTQRGLGGRLRAMAARGWVVRVKLMPTAYELAPAARRGGRDD